MRILIVEDDWLLADDLRSLLEQDGCEVVGLAADCETALRLADCQKPDVAFVDMRLQDGCTGPGIGLALANRGICVIFATGEPHLAPRNHPRILGTFAKPVLDSEYLVALTTCRRQVKVNDRTDVTTSDRKVDE
ncbi:MAG TPA: response regulator [Beijerinckiaceae bacterium]|jgi:DNA-binding response OmpR family regulator